MMMVCWHETYFCHIINVLADSFLLYMQLYENFSATILTKSKSHRSLFTIMLIVLSHAVAFIQFSQSAYTQDENSSSLSVSLVLDPFSGSGSGSTAITQDIVEQIIAFVQVGNTATGKEVIA